MPIKKTSSRTPKSGFSLVELLLVMVLLPVLFFAVYSNFTAGFKIWARVVRATPEEDIGIFYSKASKSLESMQRFASIPFTGDKEEVTFAATVQAVPELGGDRGIGQVRIFYDPDKHIVIRESKDYSQLYQEKQGAQSVLLQHVTSFELSYFTKDPMENEYRWSDSWKTEPNKLPVAVRMTFAIDGISEAQECTVFIPVGGLIK